MDKKRLARFRRQRSTRAHIKKLGAHRLTVHRTLKHIYAQIISPTGGKVLAQASSLDKEVRGAGALGSNIKAAAVVGRFLGERAKKEGIGKVAFDRSGFRYHGRIKALAEAAREAGLEF